MNLKLSPWILTTVIIIVFSFSAVAKHSTLSPHCGEDRHMLPGRSPSPSRRNQESHQHHSKFAQIKEVVNGKGTAFLKKIKKKLTLTFLGSCCKPQLSVTTSNYNVNDLWAILTRGYRRCADMGSKQSCENLNWNTHFVNYWVSQQCGIRDYKGVLYNQGFFVIRVLRGQFT